MEMADAELAVALAGFVPQGVLIGHRPIAAGDEDALLPSEILSPTSVLKVRRQSGAARLLARSLLKTSGVTCEGLARASSGAPVWPSGFTGSLAHDDTVAVAVVAPLGPVRGVGIDI